MAKIDQKTFKEALITLGCVFAVLFALAVHEAWSTFSIKNVGSAPFQVYQGDLLLGEHYTQHKAEERAVNAAMKCKCLIEIKRNRVIEVEYTPEEGETPVEGGPEETTVDHFISWNPPTARTDGEPLTEEEIGGYKVRRLVLQGEAFVIHEDDIDVGNVKTVQFTVPEGVYKYQVLTYDTTLQESVYSDPIDLTEV